MNLDPAVAAITRRVRFPVIKIADRAKPVHAARRGQLPDLNRVQSEMRDSHFAFGFGDVLDLGETRFKI